LRTSVRTDDALSSAPVFNPTWFYVGVLYAAAVWLIRRSGIELPKRVAVFFYALVFLFLYLPLTQDYVNLPADFLKTLPPWSDVTRDHHVANPQMNDLVLQIAPWAHQVREAWSSGNAPLWNGFSASGYPLLANPQSSALSPIRLLALPLFDLGQAMTGEAALKILTALTCMYLWCRRRGYSELASVTGAVAFGFSTFIIVWLHFPLVTSACLLPAIFYVIDLLAERVTFGRFTAAAAIWAAMLFGGHPETASHTFFLALLYVLWLVFVEKTVRLKFFLTLGGAMCVAALLAAPLLAPFAESLTRSKRYQELKANPPRAEVPYSDWPSAMVLLQPHFTGQVPFEKPWGPAHAESITGFAGFLGIAAWFALLANVIATRRWRSREMFFVIATVIVWGVMMGWPGVSEAFHFLFRLAANARVRLLFVLLLAVQTAAAIDLLQLGGRRPFLIGILGASATLLYLFLGSPFQHAYQVQTAVLASAPSIGVLLVATIVALTSKRRDLALLFLLVVVTEELWTASHGWNPTIDRQWMYPKTPAIRALETLRTQNRDPFRIVGLGPTFFQNTPAMYGFEDVRAHDPMVNGRYLGILRTLTTYDPADYFAKWNDVSSRLLDYLGVKYVMAGRHTELPDTERYPLVYDGPDGRIFENRDALPRFFPVHNVVLEFRDDVFVDRLRAHSDWAHTALLENLEIENDRMRLDFLAPRAPGDTREAASELVTASPTDYRLHIRAPRYTLMVSSVPAWPGWKVLRNGARIEPIVVNGGFLGFAVPEGEVDVRVWYDPWSWKVGVGTFALTVAALVAAGLRKRLTGTSYSTVPAHAHPPA
jgi:hypothetical protein